MTNTDFTQIGAKYDKKYHDALLKLEEQYLEKKKKLYLRFQKEFETKFKKLSLKNARLHKQDAEAELRDKKSEKYEESSNY